MLPVTPAPGLTPELSFRLTKLQNGVVVSELAEFSWP
jgi:hypothetical protein